MANNKKNFNKNDDKSYSYDDDEYDTYEEIHYFFVKKIQKGKKLDLNMKNKKS